VTKSAASCTCSTAFGIMTHDGQSLQQTTLLGISVIETVIGESHIRLSMLEADGILR